MECKTIIKIIQYKSGTSNFYYECRMRESSN